MSSAIHPRAGEIDFGILLNMAFGAFKDSLHESLSKKGFEDLGGSFGYVLRTLEKHPEGLSLKDLAAELSVTPQGTLKIVEDMVQKGYVSRTVDKTDTRVKRLRVDARGRALLAEAKAFHRQFEQQLIRRHGKEKVAAARKILEELINREDVGSTIRMQLL